MILKKKIKNKNLINHEKRLILESIASSNKASSANRFTPAEQNIIRIRLFFFEASSANRIKLHQSISINLCTLNGEVDASILCNL